MLSTFASNRNFLLRKGFGLCGIPENLLRALNKSNIENLTIISSTAGTKEDGVGILLHSKKVQDLSFVWICESLKTQADNLRSSG